MNGLPSCQNPGMRNLFSACHVFLHAYDTHLWDHDYLEEASPAQLPSSYGWELAQLLHAIVQHVQGAPEQRTREAWDGGSLNTSKPALGDREHIPESGWDARKNILDDGGKGGWSGAPRGKGKADIILEASQGSSGNIPEAAQVFGVSRLRPERSAVDGKDGTSGGIIPATSKRAPGVEMATSISGVVAQATENRQAARTDAAWWGKKKETQLEDHNDGIQAAGSASHTGCRESSGDHSRRQQTDRRLWRGRDVDAGKLPAQNDTRVQERAFGLTYCGASQERAGATTLNDQKVGLEQTGTGCATSPLQSIGAVAQLTENRAYLDSSTRQVKSQVVNRDFAALDKTPVAGWRAGHYDVSMSILCDRSRAQQCMHGSSQQDGKLGVDLETKQASASVQDSSGGKGYWQKSDKAKWRPRCKDAYLHQDFAGATQNKSDCQLNGQLAAAENLRVPSATRPQSRDYSTDLSVLWLLLHCLEAGQAGYDFLVRTQNPDPILTQQNAVTGHGNQNGGSTLTSQHADVDPQQEYSLACSEEVVHSPRTVSSEYSHGAAQSSTILQRGQGSLQSKAADRDACAQPATTKTGMQLASQSLGMQSLPATAGLQQRPLMASNGVVQVDTSAAANPNPAADTIGATPVVAAAAAVATTDKVPTAYSTPTQQHPVGNMTSQTATQERGWLHPTALLPSQLSATLGSSHVQFSVRLCHVYLSYRWRAATLPPADMDVRFLAASLPTVASYVLPRIQQASVGQLHSHQGWQQQSGGMARGCTKPSRRPRDPTSRVALVTEHPNSLWAVSSDLPDIAILPPVVQGVAHVANVLASSVKQSEQRAATKDGLAAVEVSLKLKLLRVALPALETALQPRGAGYDLAYEPRAGGTVSRWQHSGRAEGGTRSSDDGCKSPLVSPRRSSPGGRFSRGSTREAGSQLPRASDVAFAPSVATLCHTMLSQLSSSDTSHLTPSGQLPALTRCFVSTSHLQAFLTRLLSTTTCSTLAGAVHPSTPSWGSPGDAARYPRRGYTSEGGTTWRARGPPQRKQRDATADAGYSSSSEAGTDTTGGTQVAGGRRKGGGTARGKENVYVRILLLVLRLHPTACQDAWSCLLPTDRAVGGQLAATVAARARQLRLGFNPRVAGFLGHLLNPDAQAGPACLEHCGLLLILRHPHVRLVLQFADVDQLIESSSAKAEPSNRAESKARSAAARRPRGVMGFTTTGQMLSAVCFNIYECTKYGLVRRSDVRRNGYQQPLTVLSALLGALQNCSRCKLLVQEAFLVVFGCLEKCTRQLLPAADATSSWGGDRGVIAAVSESQQKSRGFANHPHVLLTGTADGRGPHHLQSDVDSLHCNEANPAATGEKHVEGELLRAVHPKSTEKCGQRPVGGIPTKAAASAAQGGQLRRVVGSANRVEHVHQLHSELAPAWKPAAGGARMQKHVARGAAGVEEVGLQDWFRGEGNHTCGEVEVQEAVEQLLKCATALVQCTALDLRVSPASLGAAVFDSSFASQCPLSLSSLAQPHASAEEGISVSETLQHWQEGTIGCGQPFVGRSCGRDGAAVAVGTGGGRDQGWSSAGAAAPTMLFVVAVRAACHVLRMFEGNTKVAAAALALVDVLLTRYGCEMGAISCRDLMEVLMHRVSVQIEAEGGAGRQGATADDTFWREQQGRVAQLAGDSKCTMQHCQVDGSRQEASLGRFVKSVGRDTGQKRAIPDPQQHAHVCSAALANARNLLLLASSSRQRMLSNEYPHVCAMWATAILVLHDYVPRLRHAGCQAAAYGIVDVLKEDVLAGLAPASCHQLLAVTKAACIKQPLAGLRILGTLTRCATLCFDFGGRPPHVSVSAFTQPQHVPSEPYPSDSQPQGTPTQRWQLAQPKLLPVQDGSYSADELSNKRTWDNNERAAPCTPDKAATTTSGEAASRQRAIDVWYMRVQGILATLRGRVADSSDGLLNTCARVAALLREVAEEQVGQMIKQQARSTRVRTQPKRDVHNCYMQPARRECSSSVGDHNKFGVGAVYGNATSVPCALYWRSAQAYEMWQNGVASLLQQHVLRLLEAADRRTSAHAHLPCTRHAHLPRRAGGAEMGSTESEQRSAGSNVVQQALQVLLAWALTAEHVAAVLAGPGAAGRGEHVVAETCSAELSAPLRSGGITLGTMLRLARDLCGLNVQAHVTCVRVVTACLGAWAYHPHVVESWGMTSGDAVEAVQLLRGALGSGSAKVVNAALDAVGRLAADGKLVDLAGNHCERSTCSAAVDLSGKEVQQGDTSTGDNPERGERLMGKGRVCCTKYGDVSKLTSLATGANCKGSAMAGDARDMSATEDKKSLRAELRLLFDQVLQFLDGAGDKTSKTAHKSAVALTDVVMSEVKSACYTCCVPGYVPAAWSTCTNPSVDGAAHVQCITSHYRYRNLRDSTSSDTCAGSAGGVSGQLYTHSIVPYAPQCRLPGGTTSDRPTCKTTREKSGDTASVATAAPCPALQQLLDSNARAVWRPFNPMWTSLAGMLIHHETAWQLAESGAMHWTTWQPSRQQLQDAGRYLFDLLWPAHGRCIAHVGAWPDTSRGSLTPGLTSAVTFINLVVGCWLHTVTCRAASQLENRCARTEALVRSVPSPALENPDCVTTHPPCTKRTKHIAALLPAYVHFRLLALVVALELILADDSQLHVAPASVLKLPQTPREMKEAKCQSAGAFQTPFDVPLRPQLDPSNPGVVPSELPSGLGFNESKNHHKDGSTWSLRGGFQNTWMRVYLLRIVMGGLVELQGVGLMVGVMQGDSKYGQDDDGVASGGSDAEVVVGTSCVGAGCAGVDSSDGDGDEERGAAGVAGSFASDSVHHHISHSGNSSLQMPSLQQTAGKEFVNGDSAGSDDPIQLELFGRVKESGNFDVGSGGSRGRTDSISPGFAEDGGSWNGTDIVQALVDLVLALPEALGQWQSVD